MLKTQCVSSQLSVKIKSDSYQLPSEVEKKINSIWEIEKARKSKKIYNDHLLSFINFENNVLNARFTDYRSYLAQNSSPDLYDVLQIRPLAISGLVKFKSQIIFGKRAPDVSQDAGKWELIPSGSLTLNTIEEQFYIELQEELGLPKNLVKSLKTFVLVEDTKSKVIDIGLEVELTGVKKDIEFFMQKRSTEYSNIQWVHETSVTQFCNEKNYDGIVDVSIELLKAQKLLLP